MSPEPVDATRWGLRALRLLDEGRRALENQWRGLTTRERPAEPDPWDRRKPPKLW